MAGAGHEHNLNALPVPVSTGLFQVSLLLLVALGTLLVFSATGFSRSLELRPDYLLRHLAFVTAGLLLVAGVRVIPRERWLAWGPWLFAVGVVLLVLVLIPGVGSKINGARRWFRVGPVSLQPSEFMKIGLPLFLAGWSRVMSTRPRWAEYLGGLVALIAVPLLIAIQPDLGTALLVFGMGACYLFLSGWPVRLFVLGLLSVVPPLVGMMIYRPYQLQRLQSFLDGFGRWEDAQYQVQQSLLTIASGGLWGTGTGRGLQKLSFLPESHTDFIFAVAGEEWGLAGMLTVIGLWLVLLLSGIRLVSRCSQDREGFALAGTLLLGIVLQALMNTGVVTALLPPKGISHPLLSYGGSNLLAVLFGLALILKFSEADQTLPQDGSNHLDFHMSQPDLVDSVAAGEFAAESAGDLCPDQDLDLSLDLIPTEKPAIGAVE